jgi:ABC-type nitrate/sulfonate/bicarbonate transport system permease component
VNFVIPQLFAATVVICALGMLLETALRRIEARVLRWRPTHSES